MEGLKLQRKKDPSLKSLVVSQFTSFLDVLQKPLREEGFHFVRLDGTMSQSKFFCKAAICLFVFLCGITLAWLE